MIGCQIQRAATHLPLVVKPASPQVELRVKLPDDQGGYWEWIAAPEVWMERLDLHLLSMGRQQGQAVRHFGELIDPTDPHPADPPVLVTRSAVDLRGCWARVMMIPPAMNPDWPAADCVTPVIVWQGMIMRRVDEPANVTDGEDPRGVQRWLCLGPERLLETMHVASTYWDLDDGQEPVELGRMDGFNRRTDAGSVAGNQSADRWPAKTGVYHFGGRHVWGHYTMLEYVLRHYVQQYDGAEAEWPLWSIEGDIDVLLALEDLTAPVAMKPVMTARELLDDIIPPAYGFDAIVMPTEDGFELRIISLLPEAVPLGDFTMPANATKATIELAGRTDVEVDFESCDVQRYDGVELVGKPIVVGLSADAKLDRSLEPDPPPTEIALQPSWTVGQWLAYIVALEDEDPNVNDGYRADDRFRDVFQRFRLRLRDDDGDPLWPPRGWPQVLDDGTLAGHGLGDPAATIYAQTMERHTLDWIPLRNGYRYDTDPPTFEGDADAIPEFLPPAAMIYVPGWGETPIGWVTIDKLSSLGYAGGTVSGLRGEWGLRVDGSPNHALAKNHWIVPPYDEPAASGFDPDIEGLDYETLVVTVAVAADHCVRMIAMLPEEERAGTGLLKRIYVPEAELHVLLPRTVVGADTGGELLYSPDDQLLVLRDDRPLLASLLPGAVGRLLRERARAEIRYAWMWPATECLGQLFEAVVVGDVRRIVNAPITSVSYDFLRGTVTLRTGQAVE